MYLNNLLIAIERSTGITENDLKNRKRTEIIDIVKGCYYLLARENGITVVDMSKRINRLHPTAVITIKRYEGYVEMRDKKVMEFLNRIKEELNDNGEK